MYHSFVPNLASLASPITTMIWKGGTMKLHKISESEQTGFETLKRKINTTTVLGLPHLGAPNTVDTDACENNVGCVLMQKLPFGGTLKPIGY